MARPVSAYDMPVGYEQVPQLAAVDMDLLTPEEESAYQAMQPEPPKNKNEHRANLAEHLDEEYLRKLATDVIDWVETDIDSRQDWAEKEKLGIRLLGVSTKTVGGGDFTGASKAVHPLMAEACVQFQARAIAEMWPPEGPVKTVALGDPSDEKEAQAARVEGFLNYQYSHQMPDAFEEEDSMLFRLPLSGSCFKKVYYDPLCGSLVSRYIESSNVIVPYAASKLATAIRYTERFMESGNDTKRKINAGIYRDVELIEARGGEDLRTEVEQEIDATEGSVYLDYDGDQPYERYECYCYLDLPGFEHKDGSKKTGIALPYVVTVDTENQVVLSVYRNWREDDELMKRWVQHVHFKFLPGLGFYGYGLLHTIGGLSEAATGVMRALLDAGGFANLQGGFRSRDAKITGGDRPVGMGEWLETEASAEEMRNAFFPLPYKEPSKTLFELLGYLDEVGRRFASTTENLVGDAKNTGPVGTTVALIEQGLKVFSGIHLRLHKAHAEEFQLLAKLDQMYLPQKYPYDVPGESRFVMQADFDDRVDVLPVSDPNMVSNTQRIAVAQATLDLAERAPDLYDMRKVHEGMLEAMRVQNREELIPEQDELPRLDPVAENMAIMTSRPAQVFPDQDHQAHLIVHGSWWSTVPEDQQEPMLGAYSAHMAEHRAQAYRQTMIALTGVPFGEVPPEMEDQVAQAAASVAQVYAQTAPPALGGMAGVEAEQRRKDIESQREIARKDAKTAADIENDRLKLEADIGNDAIREITGAQRELRQTEARLNQLEGQPTVTGGGQL